MYLNDIQNKKSQFNSIDKIVDFLFHQKLKYDLFVEFI